MEPGPIRRRGASGFTLVEVVVVLAIMGVAAAVVAPTLWRPEPRGDAALVRGLAEAYAIAREAAVARGRGAEVHVRAEDGHWVARARGAGDGRWDTLGTGDIQAQDLRIEVEQGGWAVVRFDARGRAAGDGVSAVGTTEVTTVRPEVWSEGIRVTRR